MYGKVGSRMSFFLNPTVTVRTTPWQSGCTLKILASLYSPLPNFLSYKTRTISFTLGERYSTFHFRKNCPELTKLEKRVKDGQEVDKGKSNNFSYLADCTTNYNIDSRMRKYDETDFQEPNIFDVKFS